MNNNHSNKSSNVNRPMAVISLFLVVLGFILMASFVGGQLMKAYLGEIPALLDLNSTTLDLQTLKKGLFIGQIGGTVFGLIILPLLYLLYLKKDLLLTVFSASTYKIPNFILLASALTFVLLPIIGVISDWNKSISLPESMASIETALRAMEDTAAKMTNILVYYDSVPEMLLVLFTVAFLPALAEEFVFRGIVQNELHSIFGNIHIAIFTTAALFSFIHFQFFGFFPRMILGVVLGYLYFTSGNILVSFLMHFLNNAMVVIALNLYKKGNITLDPENSKDLPIESIVISTVLSAAILYICWKVYKQRVEIKESDV